VDVDAFIVASLARILDIEGLWDEVAWANIIVRADKTFSTAAAALRQLATLLFHVTASML
jgi:hypothetical protein